MFLLFQYQGGKHWLFTSTFPTINEAYRYAYEYFGEGTPYFICDQSHVPLNLNPNIGPIILKVKEPCCAYHASFPGSQTSCTNE